MGKKQAMNSSNGEANIKNKVNQNAHLKEKLDKAKLAQTVNKLRSHRLKQKFQSQRILQLKSKPIERNCCGKVDGQQDPKFTTGLKKELQQRQQAKQQCQLSKEQKLQNALFQALQQNDTLRLRVAELEAFLAESQQQNYWLKDTIQTMKSGRRQQFLIDPTKEGEHQQQKNKINKLSLERYRQRLNGRDNLRGAIRLQCKTAWGSLNQERQAFSNSFSMSPNSVKQAVHNDKSIHQNIPQTSSHKRPTEDIPNLNFPIQIKPKRKIRK